MKNPTKTQQEKPVKKTNYTPYRQAYSQAKSALVKKHQAEFKEILSGLLPKKDN